jgi:glucose-1-phosphate thymidylyltransferase
MKKQIKKGIVLAGGNGTRLRPLTYVTNKSLLPVYDKPMIYHPIETLKSMGCDDIMIVSSPEHVGQVVQLLGSGRKMGVKFSYEIQDEAGGIAEALGLCKEWANNESVIVILGDNIYIDNDDLKTDNKVSGAMVFLKDVHDPERFGVAEIDWDTQKIKSIEEKPKKPKSRYCVTGLYVYDNRVWDIIKTLKPSGRGELEITDVNNQYVEWGDMDYKMVNSPWVDAGTFDSLNSATNQIINYRAWKEKSIEKGDMKVKHQNGSYI